MIDKIPQWVGEIPTEDGEYWFSVYNFAKTAYTEPRIARVSGFGCKYGGKPNVYLTDGTMPKLASFCKMHPEAMWCKVILPPSLPVMEVSDNI